MDLYNTNITPLFQPLLHENEEILWVGRPNPRKVIGPEDLYLIPFSLFWSGFAFFWEYMAITQTRSESSGDPSAWVFSLFGLPFILVGLYMLIGRFIYKSWKKSHTYYAVTTQRVIILQGRRVSTTRLDALPTLNMELNHDGSGDILLGNGPNPTWPFMWSRFYGYGPSVPQLNDVPKVQQVYTLIEDARQRLKAQ